MVLSCLDVDVNVVVVDNDEVVVYVAVGGAVHVYSL